MTSLLGETYHINSTLRKGILLLLFMFVMCVVNAQEFATDSLTQKVDFKAKDYDKICRVVNI